MDVDSREESSGRESRESITSLREYMYVRMYAGCLLIGRSVLGLGRDGRGPVAHTLFGAPVSVLAVGDTAEVAADVLSPVVEEGIPSQWGRTDFVARRSRGAGAKAVGILAGQIRIVPSLEAGSALSTASAEVGRHTGPC